MNGLRIRPMGPDEISIAMNWAAAEDWNPGFADDACFAAFASVRHRGPDLDRNYGCTSSSKRAYHKGGYDVPFRHSFNRRHYRHGTY